MTVVAVTGAARGGKTTVVTWLGIRHHIAGLDVYSSFWVGFPYVPINLDELAEWQDRQEQLIDLALLVDEIHLWADSRHSMSVKNRVMSYFAYQAKKRNVEFIFSTHRTRLVDWRIIDNVDVLIECEMVVKDDRGRLAEYTKTLEPLVVDGVLEPFVKMTMLNLGSKTGAVRMLEARPIFPYFNTRELLGLTEGV